MFDILASGHYYSDPSSQQALPDIREQVNAICRERPRRIDRYTELALLGSARCLDGKTVPPSTGLYLGSRFASLSNTIAMHRQMITQGETPKPAHFINSLSNSAGYYVARNLALQDRNLFVSRTDASLIAALQLAALDLSSAAISHALIGIVEEAVIPQQEHCKRLGVPEQTPLGEGSHWLLLAPCANKNSPRNENAATLGRLDNILSLPDKAALQRWLDEMTANSPNCQVYAPAPTWEQHAHQLQGITRFTPPLAYYPAVTAGALLVFLNDDYPQNQANNLLCVIADSDQRFHVLRAQRNRQPT